MKTAEPEKTEKYALAMLFLVPALPAAFFARCISDSFNDWLNAFGVVFGWYLVMLTLTLLCGLLFSAILAGGKK